MGTRFTGSDTRKVRTSSETVSPLDQFVRRLRSAGATEDEIAAVRDVWDSDDDGWLVTKRQLAKLTDQDLRRLVEHGRREHYEHTHSEDEEAAEVRAARYRATRHELAQLTADRPMPARDVPEWVGADPVRAAVALEAERANESPRKTVLALLEGLADPDPVPADIEEATDEGTSTEELPPVVPAPVADLEHTRNIADLPTTAAPVSGGIEL